MDEKCDIISAIFEKNGFKKMKKTPTENEVIASMVDLNRLFKEKAGVFLQYAAARFRANHALLLIQTGESNWNIFSSDHEGNTKSSKKQAGSFDWKRVFKKGVEPISREEIPPKIDSFLKLIPSRAFVAAPLAGPGKKLAAALAVTWEHEKKMKDADLKKISAFTEEGVSKLMANLLTMEELSGKNRKLVRLGAMKDDHFQMVVHDLKGPISEMYSNLDLLNYNPKLTDDDKEALDTALCGCDSLYRMVVDLLDMNKMEGGKFRFSIKPFDLGQLAEMKAEKMKALAGQKEVVFDLKIAPNIPPVEGDEELMERVMANLYSNAITYSHPNQSITVEIQYLEKENLVQVRVQDRREGIPKSMHKKIFEKFGQSYKSGTRKRYSTGLGLTFCKMAISSHRGKLWVDSEEGQGSAFYFTLPVHGSE